MRTPQSAAAARTSTTSRRRSPTAPCAPNMRCSRWSSSSDWSTGRTLQSYLWARFAQPTVVLWAREPAVRERITRALATAVMTTARETRDLLEPEEAPESVWTRAFCEAYRTELRAEAPERGERPLSGVRRRATTRSRASSTAPSAASPTEVPERRRRAERKWRRRRIVGKTLSVLRLMKSAFTFEDGADLSALEDRAPFRRAVRADALAEAPSDPRLQHAVLANLSGRRLSLIAVAHP